MMPAKWIERLYKSDEVARDEPGPLMNQLVERVLAVRSRLTPVDWRGFVVHVFPLKRDMLAIAFHRQLLEVGWKPLQVLLVGQDRHGLRPKEIAVPDAQKTHEDRKVLLEGSGAEVFIHLVESAQHGAKIFRADSDYRRKPDGGRHRVAAADPVPEFKPVGGVDAELRVL